MDTAQWPQANSDHRHLEMGKSSLMEEIMVPSGAACSARPQVMERRPRPQREQALNCPRCQSTNTKFCYYNNYSLTQPRYFCKTCRRYWTEGGSLRNVPVGGGSRKNKRPSSSSTITTKTSTPSTTPTSSLSSSATSARNLPPDHLAPPGSTSFRNPNKFHEGQDLNLAFPPQQQHMNGSLGELFPTIESSNAGANPPTCSSAAATGGTSISAMELLRCGLSAHEAPPPSHFMPMMAAAAEAGVAYNPSVFGLQDFRSTSSLSFSLDGIGGGYGNVQGVQEGTTGVGRVFFPYEDLRQVSSTPTEIIEQNRVQGTAGPSSGFWNGVMGSGAGSW